MDIIKVFGTNMKTYRQSLGLSQEAFADKCGLHRTYISAIECFHRSISLENVQNIVDAFLELKLIFSLLTIAKQEINSVVYSSSCFCKEALYICCTSKLRTSLKSENQVTVLAMKLYFLKLYNLGHQAPYISWSPTIN